MAVEKVKSRFGGVMVLFDHRKLPHLRRFKVPRYVKEKKMLLKIFKSFSNKNVELFNNVHIDIDT